MVKALLLFLTGLVAGFINVMAGGGSFFTVSAMIFMGIPPTVANGTNRVAILLQNVVAVKKFRDLDILPEGFASYIAVAVLGSVIGAYFGSAIPDEAFKKALGLIIIAVSALSLTNPEKLKFISSKRAFPWIGFFLVGVYGGFVQAGVGFFILAILSAMGLDLVRANSVKVLIILVFTVFALFVFAVKGKVDLAAGIPLACGNALGAYVAVVVSVKKGHGFVKKIVLATLFAIAIKLLLA